MIRLISGAHFICRGNFHKVMKMVSQKLLRKPSFISVAPKKSVSFVYALLIKNKIDEFSSLVMQIYSPLEKSDWEMRVANWSEAE